jgi:uncharacterized RmlC-like cupin family protein
MIPCISPDPHKGANPSRSLHTTPGDEAVTILQLVGDGGRKPACRVLAAGKQFTGKNGHMYAPGVSAQSVGARRINLQVAAIPPGAWSKAHKHAGHETAIYVLSGEAGMWYGEKLEDHLVARAGDFVYVPADVPHLPYNLSDVDYCVAIVARTDPDEQESVVLMPEFDNSI